MPKPPAGRTGRLLLVCGLLAILLPAGQVRAAATPPVIQPGSRLTMGGDGCTASWVFRGAGPLRGQQFLGTARHCVSRAGESVYLTDGPFPVSFAPALLVGKVAYLSHAFDFALIRIDPRNFKYVRPSMAGHPDIPQTVANSTRVKVGDICQFSGHGVGFDGTRQTEQSRIGLLAYYDRSQQYCDGPVTNGDSGGPIADTTAGDAAIGIVDTLGAEVGGTVTAVAGESGVALTALLTDAARHAFPISLRTVSHH